MNNKKWVYGLIVSLVVIIALGAGVCIKVRSTWMANRGQVHTSLTNPVYADLFLLNSSSNLKLSAEQARAVLPILDQMQNADSTNFQELDRQIYAQLDSQQYQALLNLGKSRQKTNTYFDRRGDIISRNGYYVMSKDQSLRLAALPDLVIKQLQEIAAGQSSIGQTPAVSQPEQKQSAPPFQPEASSGNGPQ